MSALAHRLEALGFATTALGLVRVQMEKVRPPRGLWVPFELGRPLGEPEDKAFQRRVLLHALGLLERTDGPVILEDYPEDAPGWQARPGWQPPDTSAPSPPLPDSGAGWAALVGAEIAGLRPRWDAAQARFGRTMVGLCDLPPEKWPEVMGQFLDGALPLIPPHETPALSLRFLADDLKAYYSEAAQAEGAAPSSRQIDGWFWRHTAAGALLIALRSMAARSENNALKTVGTRFFVPTPFVPPD